MKVLVRGAAILVVIVVVLIVIGSQRAPISGNGSSLLTEYGGSQSVYSQIAADTDCASLQETFDRAGDNNDTAEPGSAEHRWTLGYMKAANDRMEAIGCY